MPTTDQYIAFDLETTGLNVEFDRVIEIGAVRFDAQGRELDRFEQLINPQRPTSPGAQAVNGIRDSELARAQIASDVLPRFLAFVQAASGAPLIAHNAGFDAKFLGRELGRAGMPTPSCPVHDTLALSRRRLPALPSHRLDRLIDHFRLGSEVSHRALGDALLVKDVWLRLDGPNAPAGMLVSYPVHDPSVAAQPPRGWESLDRVAREGGRVWIVYEGGTRGADRREISPRRFTQKGGVAYVVAFCHVGSREKFFRLDRIREYEAVAAP
ncbi:MAG: exonuclease domain-containing protein [Paludisphaera borealis]|uniref:exonuclease domain-containing protein n=1 Tax=Paludisphaera borealis TaxID=1387353 RepID=UPI0028508D20|nr:exonuclease domain-containing protein [Paludisphaera borealis]MDR3619096.1 exonuclease domain-containing protein [Paludisphaera borealis]